MATPIQLGVLIFTALTLGQSSLGCEDDDCEHDWQCGESQICIPLDARNQCVSAPVCDSNADCASDEPCLLRRNRIVEEGSHDPFTLDEPAKQTCGGFDGPADVRPVQSGCGPSGGDDDYDGGSGGSGASGASGGSGNGGSGNGGSGNGGTGGSGAGGEGASGGEAGAGGTGGEGASGGEAGAGGIGGGT